MSAKKSMHAQYLMLKIWKSRVASTICLMNFLIEKKFWPLKNQLSKKCSHEYSKGREFVNISNRDRHYKSDAADEVILLFGHFFVSKEQSQYCDYALETKKLAKKHSHLICSIWPYEWMLKYINNDKVTFKEI